MWKISKWIVSCNLDLYSPTRWNNIILKFKYIDDTAQRANYLLYIFYWTIIIIYCTQITLSTFVRSIWCLAVADLSKGGASDAPPESKFIQFHAVWFFGGKFGKIVCWHPPRPGELAPHLGEILDPPLVWIAMSVWSFENNANKYIISEYITRYLSLNCCVLLYWVYWAPKKWSKLDSYFWVFGSFKCNNLELNHSQIQFREPLLHGGANLRFS